MLSAGFAAVDVGVERPGRVALGVTAKVEIEPGEIAVAGMTANAEVEPAEMVAVNMKVNVENEPADAVQDNCVCSSNLRASLHKKVEHSYNKPSWNYNVKRDTSGLPRGATTNRYRKKGIRVAPRQQRHSSQVSLSPGALM